MRKCLIYQGFQGGGQPLLEKESEKFTFFENISFPRILKSRPAFSIAEAMVTLLIISIAMAATAPIMTKRAMKEVEEKRDTGICYPKYGTFTNRSLNVTYTAEENGWLHWTGWSPDRWTPGVWINGQKVLARGAYKYGDETNFLVPVSKGDKYSANGGGLYFIPCK